MGATSRVTGPLIVISKAQASCAAGAQATGEMPATASQEAAGEEIAWVLVCASDGVTQYVSNADRKDGTELLSTLIARMKAERADIPAHYNPDL